MYKFVFETKVYNVLSKSKWNIGAGSWCKGIKVKEDLSTLSGKNNP